MNATTIRVLQLKLAAAGFDPGPADGKMGGETAAAIGNFLAQRALDVPSGWRSWVRKRQAVLCLQTFCRDAGLEVGDLDGWWGPQTEFASGQLAYLVEHGQLPHPWRDDQPLAANPHHWPQEQEAELNAFYGLPGSNLVMLNLPYALRLSWQTSTVVSKTSCNAKVRDSLLTVLENVLAHYGADGIRELRLDLYGGGFNQRKKRGGSEMSTHAWGIAFDFDPDHNKLEWGREHAAFAKPEYDAWWHYWEDQGWAGLGRVKNYDWMHVQAAKP